jgi:hypothetical protein
VYLDKDERRGREIYDSLRPDVVFVATPSDKHVEVTLAWLGKTPLVFVEKPVAERVSEIDRLLHEWADYTATGNGTPLTSVFGVDHYQLYSVPLFHHREEVDDHVSGVLTTAHFAMTESHPVEARRVTSLAAGMTVDMWPHLPALMALFGALTSIDEIELVDAAIYDPPIACDVDPDTGEWKNVIPLSPRFTAETYSESSCAFSPAGQAMPIKVEATVGKGVDTPSKFFEVATNHGHAVRVDFGASEANGAYPSGTVMLLCTKGDSSCDHGHRPFDDPHGVYLSVSCVVNHDGSLAAWPIARDRYVDLVTDLCAGTTGALANILTVQEARDIVRAIERLRSLMPEQSELRKYDLAGADVLRTTGDE